MTTETKRKPQWVKDAVTFLGFALFNAALMWIGLNVYRSWDRGEPEWVHWWLWTFAAPVWTAHAFQRFDLHWPLVWLNPFIYGAVWWLCWRMFRLMRPE